MHSWRLWMAIAVSLLLVGSTGHVVRAESPQVEPRDVRKIVADGRHNAFTALVRWRDAYWLAFRTAANHNSTDGDLVVLRSTDFANWSETHRVNAVPDDRDPQFLATESKLFLYDAGLTGTELRTYLTTTSDGEKWTEPKAVYEPRFIVWKPVAVGGKFYAGAHFKSESGGGKDRSARLIESSDGVDWKTVSQIRAGNWESETTMFFPEPNRAVAFLRQKYGSPDAAILEATAPFAEWTTRPAGVHLSGHCVHTFAGVTYLISRTRQGGKTGTMVYTFEQNQLKPYCSLPSGGDCSYAEAVVAEGREMLLSYYSSHEGATNIYTCRVPLR